MKLYSDLAYCWDVLTPRGTYDLEAVQILEVLKDHLPQFSSILELGSGVGALLESFPDDVEVVFLERSKEMLALSKQRNPSREHLQQDMLKLDLGRSFDAIVLHDAVMYLTDRAQVLTCFKAAYEHLDESGIFLVFPDVTAEFFQEHAICGGAETDRCAVQLLEWHWDPDPADDQIQVDFSVLIREAGVVKAHHESHSMGIFTIDAYQSLLREAGFSTAQLLEGVFEGIVFLARRG